MLFDKGSLSIEEDGAPGQSDTVDEDPVFQKRHEGPHDEGREQMHVQSISRVPELSACNRKRR